MDKTNQFNQVLTFFPIKEEVIEISPIGNGHINDTLGVKVLNEQGTPQVKYVLQRINHEVFQDIETLQKNIFIVTRHIKEKLKEKGGTDIDRHSLTFCQTKDGQNYIKVGDQYWRLMLFIPQSHCYESLTPQLAYEAGKAFGDFHSMLSDMPSEALGETIPNFHNMSFRLQQLKAAIKADNFGRVSEVTNLLKGLEERAEEMTIQERLYKEGALIKRITHCDTKVNNILFDANTGDVLCVIDLDTVMPGFVMSDIGDFIRTAVNTAAEDEEDLNKISVNMEIFESYTKGYLEKAKVFLTPTEIKLLPYGGRLLTYMQTVRFLTDYINGDVYYKTHKPKHNLIRAIAQFQFLLKLEEKKEEMERFMAQWI